MAFGFRLALLLLLSWRCTLGVVDQAERPTCDQVLVSIQELRRETININETAENGSVLCINLPQGTEVITEYSVDEIKHASVIISGNDSVIKCVAYHDGDLPLSDYTKFPLIFSNSSLVVMKGVHFEGCVRPLLFKWVTRIELDLSSFSNFYPGGALEISNSPHVFVSNCTFTNNTSLGIGMRRYSGNAGAIAIGYDDRPKPDYLQNIPPLIRVTGSTFRENNSTAVERFQFTVGRVLSQRFFKERGGAIACYFGSTNYSADVEISGCTFERSNVSDSGGAVYMFLSGQDNGHIVKIEGCNFTENRAKLGGGVELTFDTFLSNSLEVLINHALVKDCLFERNRARDGAGFSHIQINKQENLNNLTIKNCLFVDNRAPLGSALSLKYIFTVNYASLKKMVFIEDCTFLGNSARYGVIYASRNTVGLQGNTIFTENTGPAIQSFGSLLTFGGDLLFSNNRNHPNGFSGVINLAAFGQIMLEKGAKISFINNTGINGGAFVVTGQLSTAQQLYNPQCFLQYEDSTAPPPLWNVTVFFEGNRAEVGPIMYASNFNACTWFNESSPFFNPNLEEVWTFMDIRDNYLLRRGTTELRRDYYFQTSVQRLSLDQETVHTASPGDTVVISVSAMDVYNHKTNAFLEIKDANDADSATLFEPSIVQSNAGEGRVSFMYLSNDTSGNTTVQLLPSFISEEVPGLEVTLVHSSCLPGYFLRDGECVCEETDTVAVCDLERRGVVLVSSLWGSPPNWSDKLVTYTCPPGYCDCSQGFDGEQNVGCLLNYTNPDGICTEARHGLLCGQCIDGYGVGLLTNDCKQFTDLVPQFWLFPLYLGFLIPLLVVIVKFGVHLPTILRGFILYVQISPIAVQFLPLTFLLRVPIMSCFGSTLALYVPYDFSFHEEMTSLESYGLRYVTPLVALIVVPISARVRRPLSKYWFGIWTVVQLLYIMAVDTSASLLLCPTLTRHTSAGTSKLTIWFYDGSVSCFSGWHIFLSIIAILSLISLVLLLFLIAAALQYDRLSKKVHPSFARLENFSLAMTRGYKEEYHWWPLMDFTCRFFFVTASVLSVGHKVVPLLLSLILFLLQFYLHPYEDLLANYIESFTLFFFVVLLALGNTTMLISRANDVASFTLWPIYYLPVLVGGIVTTVYIVYLIQKTIRQKKELIKQKYNELISQRISFHKLKSGRSNSTHQGYDVTTTEIYLYDDEQEDVDVDLDGIVDLN